MPRFWPKSLRAALFRGVLLTMAGRFLANLMDWSTTTGATMATKATRKPTTMR